MNTFIRMFTIKNMAENFAAKVNGKIVLHFNWDNLQNRLIKYYVVKY